MGLQNRRFSTGMSFLDRRIDGGIPVGTIVALTAPASSQSELLIQELTKEQELLYLSTTCPEEAEIRERLEVARTTKDSLTIKYTPPETLLEDPEAPLSDLSPESILVLDVVNSIENAQRKPYLKFLNTLKKYVRDVNCVAILHCLNIDGGSPSQRGLTLKRADHVWQLQTTALSNEIRSRLLITKSRGYRALSEPIPLVLTNRILVDTSRNIA